MEADTGRLQKILGVTLHGFNVTQVRKTLGGIVSGMCGTVLIWHKVPPSCWALQTSEISQAPETYLFYLFK